MSQAVLVSVDRQPCADRAKETRNTRTSATILTKHNSSNYRLKSISIKLKAFQCHHKKLLRKIQEPNEPVTTALRNLLFQNSCVSELQTSWYSPIFILTCRELQKQPPSSSTSIHISRNHGSLHCVPSAG